MSFLIAGIASACAALSYAEFGGLIPQAGSAYTYGYAVLGESVGWFIGWDLLLEYTAIVAVVAIGVSQYVTFLLDGFGARPARVDARRARHRRRAPRRPLRDAALPRRRVAAQPRHQDQRRGSRPGWSFVKIAIVLAVIVVGAFYVKSDNLTPYFPYGLSGAATGAATVFFAVFGYDAMSTAAEESKEAERNLPKAIVLSLAIAMVLYLLAATVLTGMQNYKDLADAAAFGVAFESVGLDGLREGGGVRRDHRHHHRALLVHPRRLAGLVRDQPRRPAARLVRRRPTTSTRRHRPVWIVGIVAAGIAGFVPIGDAAELTNIGILLAFIVVSVAVIVLRYRSPELPRTFRAPLMPFTPLLGIGFSIWLITQLQPATWMRFAVWFLIGALIYAFYGYRHSKLAKGRVVQTKDT